MQRYVDTKDYREACKVQRELLQGYLYDIKNESTEKEVDFLIRKDGRIISIEIKSSNVGRGENNCVTLPLYMVMFL